MAGITVSHLSFTYPQETVPALRDVSFSVEEGEFLTVIGPSGGGKSTLLRALKPALTPHGSFTGEISFFGETLSALDARRQAAEIGFVLQKPDDQIVTDRVWHELAFGMESLGFATPVIRRRVAEMASFFGIEEWFSRPVEALSGRAEAASESGLRHGAAAARTAARRADIPASTPLRPPIF